MAVNWNLLQPADIAGSFQQGMEQGRQTQGRNALAAYAQDPSASNLNAVAQYDPGFVMQQKQQDAQKETAAQEKEWAILGRVATYADTPDKWRAGMQYLSQFAPNFAKYADAYSEDNRMAMLAYADQLKAAQDQNEQYTLAPGSIRYDAKGNKIAEAPFAPRPVTVGEGQTVVEYAPGQSDPAGIFQNMIGAESNGQQFGADGRPLTSGAGAIGIAQVMPGTAPEAAALAGMPFDENRYRNDPQYNRALGEAYFQKQLQDFGDPALAVAAYNAGPSRVQQALQRGGPQGWLQYVPDETKAYVAKVMGNGQGRVIAQGAPKAPKPQWRTLTPQEAQQRGLPAGTYQQSPDGEIKPIGGIGEKAPQSKEAYSQSAMDAFDRAIASADRLLKHGGFNAAVGVPSLNPLDGNLAGYIVPGSPAADFRAELDAMKAQVFLPMVQSMKGMGALSNSEGEKLTASIGALDPKMSEGAFRASLNRIIADLNTYKARSMQAPAAPNRPAGKPAARPSVSNW